MYLKHTDPIKEDMAPEQADAVLHEEAQNPGEYVTPDVKSADAFIAEFEVDSLGADELISIVDTMGTMAESVANAPEGEVITEATAAALGVAVEHFCKRAGLPHQTVFALEHFEGGYAAKRQATRLALEGMTDIIKKITAKIIKFLRKIMNYLYDTMQELVFGADNILRASQEVQERARAIAHKQIKEDGAALDDARLVQFFTKDGKVYAPGDVLGTYKSYSETMKNSFSAGFVKEVGLRVHETLQEATQGESKEATEGKIDKIMQGMLKKTFGEFKEVNKGEHHETRDLELPFGERRLILLLSKENDYFTGFNITIDRAQRKDGPIQERKLETMNFEQITKLAKAIENEMLFGIFKSYKNSKGDLSRIKNAIEKGCDNIARDQQSSARRGSVVYSVNFLKDIAAALVSATAITHRYDILVARHLLMYCDRSIKMHA